MPQSRNWLNLSLLLAVGILIGSFATHSSGQDPVRVNATGGVEVYADRNAQELADLISRSGQANKITDTQLQDIYAKIEGRARVGDLRSALVLFRIAEGQRQKKKK